MRDNKRPNRNKSIASAVNKQVYKTLSAAIKAAKAEASPDALTDYQARAYIITLLKDTRDETTPAKPILEKGTLKSIIVNLKTSPK